MSYGDEGGAIGYLVGEENKRTDGHVHDDESRAWVLGLRVSLLPIAPISERLHMPVIVSRERLRALKAERQLFIMPMSGVC